jgi:formate dehydrogenase (hydrogenase)
MSQTETPRKGRKERNRPMQRLSTPLVRKNGVLTPTSWEEALSITASAFASAREQGPGGFGIFSCSKATNEVNYLAGKFARQVMGTNNIDSCNRT